MHELGIIVHIAKTLDQVAAENDLKKLDLSRWTSVRSAALCRNI